MLASILVAGSIVTAQEKDEKAKPKTEQPKMEKKKMDSTGNPVVIMKTSMGAIKIELYQDKAPVSVKNFLSYVDEKFYDNTVFHRVIKNFMIQGGGFTATDPIKQKNNKAPIVNESTNGLKNDRGTIAMARTPEPNSATSQFFINVVDNKMLNRGGADPTGYAVFGKVIEGMDVVDKIRDVKTANLAAVALNGDQEVQTTFQDVPQVKVVVLSVRRAEVKK
jgi:cyclophilin family peptidyl-prolyl cis-trans isomerase